ncbi:hypothetical protein LP419_24210 [Massilia sp. H-1]|nr:hypothetical protein LP419_24210 [Massilia sp. H-1]
MDQQKLRTLVFEKTGVRIDIDDPVFALVALNEAVLAEAVERHVALLDDATASLADQAQALIDGGHLNTHAERAPRSAAPSAALLKPTPAPTVPLEARFAAIMRHGAAVLCALLVLMGQALFFKLPAPVLGIDRDRQRTDAGTGAGDPQRRKNGGHRPEARRQNP